MYMVRSQFKPEFLNRLDDIIIFTPLSKPHLHKIIRLLIHALARRLKEKEIDLTISDDAVDLILTSAYDPAYGARPIRRFIEHQISTEMSRLLLKEELTPMSKVTIKGGRVKDTPTLVYNVVKGARPGPPPPRTRAPRA